MLAAIHCLKSLLDLLESLSKIIERLPVRIIASFTWPNETFDIFESYWKYAN